MRKLISRVCAQWAYLGLSLIVLVCDQLSKHYVVHTLIPGQSRALTSFLNMTLVYNTGIAFGTWMHLNVSLLILINSLITLAIAIYLCSLPSHKRLLSIALALMFGGGLGNIWDRIRLGHVIDFIDVHWGLYHWFVFNLSDAAISLGAFLLIVDVTCMNKKTPGGSP